MLHIARQSAGPIGRKFLWTLMGGREMLKAKKKLTFFQFFFHGQRRALQLVYSWSITSWPIHSTGLFIVQDYLDFFNSIIFFLIRLSFF